MRKALLGGGYEYACMKGVCAIWDAIDGHLISLHDKNGTKLEV